MIVSSMVVRFLATPIGELLLVGDGDVLSRIDLPGRHGSVDGAVEDADAFPAAVDQLARYFAGGLRVFDLKTDPVGGQFDRAVWDEVARIPYGATTSYGAVARTLGHPGSSRAVGAANGRNPLPIVVPCHRVVGSDGRLVGYAGGLEAKRALLGLESGGLQQSLV